MLSEEKILERFRQHGIISANELYLEIPQAFDFVATCHKNNLAVIGIEGFIYREGKLMPQLDLIADFSSGIRASSSLNQEYTWQKYREDCHKWSQQFLTDLPPRDGLVLNFIIFSEEEWITEVSRTDVSKRQAKYQFRSSKR